MNKPKNALGSMLDLAGDILEWVVVIVVTVVIVVVGLAALVVVSVPVCLAVLMLPFVARQREKKDDTQK